MHNFTLSKASSIPYRRGLLGDAAGIPAKQAISALWSVNQIPELMLSSNGHTWTAYCNKPSNHTSPAGHITQALKGQQFASRHDALQAVAAAMLIVA